MAGCQGEDLDAYKDFNDIAVNVANASRCQMIVFVSDTLITCDLPVRDEKLMNSLNDDGDASVRVIKPWL